MGSKWGRWGPGGGLPRGTFARNNEKYASNHLEFRSGGGKREISTEFSKNLITLHLKYDFYFIKFLIKDRKLKKSKKFLIFLG